MESRSRLIAVLCAVPQEMLPLVKRLGATRVRQHARPVYRARIRQTEVWLLAGGVGRKAAARSTEWLFSQGRPDLLVIAGVAGALSPGIPVGDVVIADPVLGEAGLVLPVPVHLPLLEHAGRAQLRQGPLLSLDRVLVTAAEKRSAYAHATYHPHPPPLAVDMETVAAARLAAAQDIPWAAVRAISDTAGEGLPLDFNKLRTPDGDLPPRAVVLAALTRPSAVTGLMRLAGNTRVAAESLADYLHAWLKAVAAAPP